VLGGEAVEQIERDGDHWRVILAGGQRLASRALVLADGSASRFAQPLGLGPAKPRYASAVAVEVEADVRDPATARFEFGLVQHGFCWAFPRQDGYSIGVGTFIGRNPADSDAVLAQLLPSLGLAADAGERFPSPLRVWDGHHPLHCPGAVVVGDAASLCDPFLAEGLRPALLSGVRAAEAVDLWLGGEAGALAGYTVTMRRRWGDSMAWDGALPRSFTGCPRWAISWGSSAPRRPTHRPDPLGRTGLWRHRPTGDPATAVSGPMI
jgi:flavin-dependent dehydrogenase